MGADEEMMCVTEGGHVGSVFGAIPASLQDIVKYNSIPLTHQTTNREDV